ncbi:MAG: putative quinol monooxygenase [Pseudomonadota bacterium]
MIIVLANAKLGEGALEEANTALETMVTASRAEEGVIEYNYAVDILDPTMMRITEKYADEAALSSHAKSDHMAAFQKAMASFDIKILDLTMFNADDGTKLM